MERIWMEVRENGAIKEKEEGNNESNRVRKREMEILRTVCSGLLTVLFAIKVEVSPPSFSSSLQLVLFFCFFPS